ncbi:hypothetical protein SAMN05421505_13338 [Sinosporangium album]|uniref:Uncharacterized protein n=1 Tax=Sinosporangium album TaxID=504805 RepID=A0A1G8HPQ4_9ACTN|nr:hypothetical protein SAMN05421505_13338 [Sinosporangium album]
MEGKVRGATAAVGLPLGVAFSSLAATNVSRGNGVRPTASVRAKPGSAKSVGTSDVTQGLVDRLDAAEPPVEAELYFLALIGVFFSETLT